MHLITQNGKRLDHLAEIERLKAVARVLPYSKLFDFEKELLRDLLHQMHQEKELMRYGQSPRR